MDRPKIRNDLVKVRFALCPDDWHGRSDEGLWAEPLGEQPESTFRLQNSPFFATGVSFLDVVRGIPRQDGLGFDFGGVIDRSGHSTYMLLVRPGSTEFDENWDKFQKLGCSFESATIRLSIGMRTLYAVDVPASVDVYEVYPLLQEGERRDVWTFQEGHVGHTLRS